MCGIAGIFRPGGGPPPRSGDLAGALAALRHRGPDGEGRFAEGPAALGSRRLAVIDPEGGAQPMTSADGRFVLVYNGEIHDYREVRAGLAAAGAEFRTECDTEVLLELLAREGTEALGRVSGMFAFALYDRRERSLTLGRDAFGVKPLVYSRDAATGEVRFASEGAALRALSRATPRLDAAAFAERLAFQVPLSGRTLVEGARDLEPGTVRVFGADGSTESRRWHDLRYGSEEGRSAGDWEDLLRAELERAGRIALRSDRPVGVTLSGGLDSSLTAALAVRQTGPGLKAYTGYFAAGPRYDERPWARRVAADLGLALTEVRVGPEDLLCRLPALAAALDGPIAGPGSLPQLAVAERAAEDVTVLIGGQGADETFGGYARHRLALLDAAGVLDPDALPEELAGYEPLARHLLAAGRGEPFPDRFFRLVHRGGGTRGLLGPFAREAVEGYDPVRAFREAFREENGEPFHRMASFESRTLLPALLHVEDRVTMANSLESRVPLLDPAIPALAARIPPRISFGDRGLKGILRRAARGLAPEPACSRPDKMGFPVPLAEWAAGPLGEALVARLRDGPLVPAGILAPDAPGRLVAGAGGHGRHLWFFLVLSEFLRATGVAP